jgi:glycosyltransferase involved in cell wall biosynthesis
MSKKLTILHISNDFPNSSLYKQLVLHLDELDIGQSVYSAVRTQKESMFNPPELSHIELWVQNILSRHDRLLFRLKIRRIYKDLCSRVDASNIDIGHAHTLYSDGAVALKIKQDLKIPYIVTIQNTALNAFGKYRPDLKWRRDKILKEAEKVVFYSPAYKQKLLRSLSSKIREQVKNKSIIIPNGIDPYFLHAKLPKIEDNRELKLLFVGRFLKIKNIPSLIKASEILPKKLNVSLSLVGGGKEEERILKIVDSKPAINYLGYVRDKKELRRIYQDHDIFVMASKPETFGLVYIEALSQGVPVIHTEGEGIDRLFKNENISESVVDPKDAREIAQKIQLLAHRLNVQLRRKCQIAVQKFDWSLISKRYKELYEFALRI